MINEKETCDSNVREHVTRARVRQRISLFGRENPKTRDTLRRKLGAARLGSPRTTHGRHVIAPPAAAAVQVGDRLTELVRYEGVEERIETAVEIEHERGYWRNDEYQIRVGGGVRGPALPLQPGVMRQHADGERDDEGNQQSDDSSPTAQRMLLIVRR